MNLIQSEKSHIKNLFTISILFLLLILTGCSESEKIKIQVEKQITQDKTEIIKEITNQDSIKKIQAILEKVEWSNKIVDMARQPDTILKFKNIGKDNLEENYQVWLNNNNTEITKESGSYSKLSTKDSKLLNELIK